MRTAFPASAHIAARNLLRRSTSRVRASGSDATTRNGRWLRPTLLEAPAGGGLRRLRQCQTPRIEQLRRVVGHVVLRDAIDGSAELSHQRDDRRSLLLRAVGAAGAGTRAPPRGRGGGDAAGGVEQPAAPPPPPPPPPPATGSFVIRRSVARYSSRRTMLGPCFVMCRAPFSVPLLDSRMLSPAAFKKAREQR